MKSRGAQPGNSNNFKHGMIDTREYSSWGAMKDRCLCSTHHAFHRYGGRGIKICDEWINSFESFYNDMGDRPEGTSLDRIDNDGGYNLENCKWSTSTEQNNNKRDRVLLINGVQTNNSSGITGVGFKDNGWQVRIGKTYLGFSKDFFNACCLRKSAEFKLTTGVLS